MWKDSKDWDQERDGVITQEFFKWMGNTTKTDMKKMALHLLNRAPKRKHLHPKVMVKKISGVVVDCYNVKEWLERIKRKHAVRRFLYQEKQSLGFFDSNGNYKLKAWKNFKTKYDITKATKMLLLTAPKEEFFSQVKRPLNKNMKCRELSPYAAEFFKVFLRSKGRYKKPEARAYLRCYNMEKDEIGAWGDQVWDNSMANSIKLAVMDFRNIPGIINKETTPKDALYFLDFLDMAKKLTDLYPTDPAVWLWITGDQEVDNELRIYIRGGDFGATYIPHYVVYIPAVPAKCLEDLNPSSSQAKAPVNLIFMVK